MSRHAAPWSLWAMYRDTAARTHPGRHQANTSPTHTYPHGHSGGTHETHANHPRNCGGHRVHGWTRLPRISTHRRLGMKDERLMMTAEELAQRNGANLLATQLQYELREKVERARSHVDEMRSIRTQLSEAQLIGVRVMQAKRDGRKTVRIADLLGDVTP